MGGYKIKRGRYGGLTIDLPKLRSQLLVVAKNGKGEKVYHQQGDFDTLDLLTKRFNSKKRYSDLAVKIFNDLNELSGTPINRNSKKYQQLGRGTFYYNDPKELFDRLELLGREYLGGEHQQRCERGFHRHSPHLEPDGEDHEQGIERDDQIALWGDFVRIAKILNK